MSKIDVRDLEREELPAGNFPVDPRSPFRLQIAPEVHRGIQAHAKADPSVEICGILVGRWGRDELGPFAQVTDYIRCENASSKLAEVTFTHESWAQINHEMDTKYADKRIVGWYHTHPDFGIFLSDRDSFIHEHFFSGAGQVAYVVDPVRELEGVFSWQNGKPTPMTHYWVGNELRTVQSSERSAGHRTESMSAVQDAMPMNASAASVAYERASLSSTTTLLAGIALFLLGYMLAGARTRWEQQSIIEGAVAHYGYNKLMKLGLDQDLMQVRKALRSIETELEKLPEATDKLSAAEAEKADRERRLMIDSLQVVEQAMERMQTKYSHSDEEKAVLAQIVAAKQAELSRPLKAGERGASSAAKVAPNAPANAAANSPAAKSNEARPNAVAPLQPGATAPPPAAADAKEPQAPTAE